MNPDLHTPSNPGIITQEDKSQTLKAKKRAPTALTVDCGVCSGPAPDHLHFGARCCYSCRAFFRRTAPRKSTLRCRSGLGECDVAHRNKKCISCRYQKCINIGMNPHLVQGSRKKDTGNNNGEEDYLMDEEEETEPKDESSTSLQNAMLSSDLASNKCQTVHSNTEKHYPESQTIKGVVINRKRNCPSYHQMQIEEEDRNPTPYFQYNPQYSLFSYPYNAAPLPTGYNTPKKEVLPYNTYPGINRGYEDKREIASQFHPGVFQSVKQEHKHDSLEFNRVSSKIVMPKQEHEIKREPLTGFDYRGPQQEPYRQPYTKDQLFKASSATSNSRNREEILCHRTSVITHSRHSQAELMFKASRVLQQKGAMFIHQGELHNYHASLLEKDRMQRVQDSVINTHSQKECKEVKKESRETFLEKEDFGPTEDMADQLFQHAQELVESSDHLIEELFGGNKTYAHGVKTSNDVDDITDIFTLGDLPADLCDINPHVPVDVNPCPQAISSVNPFTTPILDNQHNSQAVQRNQMSVIQTPGLKQQDRIFFNRSTNNKESTILQRIP